MTFTEWSKELENNMIDWFEERTNKHISLVKKYCEKIDAYDHKRFNGIVKRGEEHDASKFKEPERTPYILISWRYKCKHEGKKFDFPKSDTETNAWLHHAKQNRHHPEFFDAKKDGLIDGSKMTDLDIGEMISDWCAMGEELGNSPKEWADKNIGKRWTFTDDQKKTIYELIKAVWK